MKESFFVILFPVIVLAFMALGFWLFKRFTQKLPATLRVIGVITLIAIGFAIGINGPLRHARVLSDSDLLSYGPFKTEYLRGTGPESQIVWLRIENAKGRYMYLDIDRSTRLVNFSHVYVPNEIQF